MSKATFNNGDIVRIKREPYGVSKKVQALGGKIGKVVGRKASGMAVYYQVEIDGTVFQVKNASNLIGPLPKEVLKNSNFIMPKTNRDQIEYYDKHLQVVYVESEMDDLVGIYSKINSNNTPLKYIRRDTFEKNYTPIHSQYKKYITILKGRELAYRVCIKELLDQPRKLAKIFTRINTFEDDLITVDVLNKLLLQDEIVIGRMKYKLSFNYNYNFCIEIHYINNRVLKDICTLSIQTWKTCFAEDGSVRILLDTSFAERATDVVNHIIGTDIMTVEELKKQVVSEREIYIIGEYRISTSGHDPQSFRLYSKVYKRVVEYVLDREGKVIKGQMHDLESHNDFRSFIRNMGDLGGILNL